jgi:hypothetical protein
MQLMGDNVDDSVKTVKDAEILAEEAAESKVVAEVVDDPAESKVVAEIVDDLIDEKSV